MPGRWGAWLTCVEYTTRHAAVHCETASAAQSDDHDERDVPMPDDGQNAYCLYGIAMECILYTQLKTTVWDRHTVSYRIYSNDYG